MTDINQQKSVFVTTFGCQMNEYDSERMVRLLSEDNWAQTNELNQADMILLNTCSIRAKAEQKVYSMLGRLRPLKENNPDLIIGVCGCVAQQEGEKLLKAIPYLDLVLGTHGIHLLPNLVRKISETGDRICRTGFEYVLPEAEGSPTLKPKIKSFLTIMQGCDNYCAYCVVPYVRGRETSRNPEDILSEAKSLIACGVKEITLLGQNVNSYGGGLEPELSFAALIEKIAELDGLIRLRFTTSHPKDLSPDLMKVFSSVGSLCEHIHLPVQSGSNRVLAAMNRKYTREDYLAKIRLLKDLSPDIAITTDIIVGFPGETEDDNKQTLDMIQSVRFDGMFSFKYSNRPNTQASRMSGQLIEETKSRRLLKLQNIQKKIILELNRELVGKTMEILVEGPGKKAPDQYMGRTRSNRVVNFTSQKKIDPGSCVHVKILEALPNSLRGLVEEPDNGTGVGNIAVV